MSVIEYPNATVSRYSTPLQTSPMKPPVLISVVSRSPVCGWNIEPCINRPHMNMSVTDPKSSAPRPGRLSRKWPPPGISHPSATAGAQAVTGAIGGFCSFSFAIAFFEFIRRLLLDCDRHRIGGLSVDRHLHRHSARPCETRGQQHVDLVEAGETRLRARISRL